MNFAVFTWVHISSKVISILLLKMLQKCKPVAWMVYSFFKSFGKMVTLQKMHIHCETKA